MSAERGQIVKLHEVPPDESRKRKIVAMLEAVLERARAGEFDVAMVVLDSATAVEWQQAGSPSGHYTLGLIAGAYHNCAHACSELIESSP